VLFHGCNVNEGVYHCMNCLDRMPGRSSASLFQRLASKSTDTIRRSILLYMDCLVLTPVLNQKHWHHHPLSEWAQQWRSTLSERLGAVGERSSWWPFVWKWPTHIRTWLTSFRAGTHQFSPMTTYSFPGETITVWCYLDRLMIHCLLKLLKPTFNHVIPVECVHLAGPNAVKTVTKAIRMALVDHTFDYVIRYDIKSYYASIHHETLLNQLRDHYQDPILQHYFNAIVTVPIDKDGYLITPEKGIPRRSALSPFFGALYLTPVDAIFANREGIVYRRFMDDGLILISSKKRYLKTKKRLFKTLRSLKLKISPHKTYCGKLDTTGFHFLGVKFEVLRSPQSQTQAPVVTLHTRTYRRALDKVQAMHPNAVHPVHPQRYLVQWATWWSKAVRTNTDLILTDWIAYAKNKPPDESWVGECALNQRRYKRHKQLLLSSY